MKAPAASMRASARVLLMAGVVGAPATALAQFTYNPPGKLVANSGRGRVDDKVYAPGMRFPIEVAPAYPNSQVYSRGGSMGPAGGQCDRQNYSYPWWDNYCETRSWDMPLCPSGQGHQGQDIRASTCMDNVHWVVATEAGKITNVGSYSVYLTTPDGTRFDYLHMRSVAVKVGEEVTKGQRVGKVSNNFGGTPTTIHLHFNIRQTVSGMGSVYVPTYMSLVRSYEALLNGTTDGGPPPEDGGDGGDGGGSSDDSGGAGDVSSTGDGGDGARDADAGGGGGADALRDAPDAAATSDGRADGVTAGPDGSGGDGRDGGGTGEAGGGSGGGDDDGCGCRAGAGGVPSARAAGWQILGLLTAASAALLRRRARVTARACRGRAAPP